MSNLNLVHETINSRGESIYRLEGLTSNHIHKVKVFISESDIDPSDQGLEPEDLKRFKSGELCSVDIRVQVYRTFEVLKDKITMSGSDTLGGCHARSANAYTKHFEQDILNIIQEYGMVENASQDLVAQIDIETKSAKRTLKLNRMIKRILETELN